MQKTVRNAANLCAKNTAKCVTYLQIFHIFIAYEFGTFVSVFCRRVRRKLYDNFPYFSSFFVMIFYGTVCRDGKGGIPVKSRSKCGNPDRDCTENTRFCSAMSTKSEIVKVIAEKRLTPRLNRKLPV